MDLDRGFFNKNNKNVMSIGPTILQAGRIPWAVLQYGIATATMVVANLLTALTWNRYAAAGPVGQYRSTVQ